MAATGALRATSCASATAAVVERRILLWRGSSRKSKSESGPRWWDLAVHRKGVATTTTTTTVAAAKGTNFDILRNQTRCYASSSLSGLFSESETSGAVTPGRGHSGCGQQRSWKVAIVGSGPSGCYTAKYLLQGLAKLRAKDKDKDSNKSNNDKSNNDNSNNIPVSCHIDVLERLPTPYGLVRNGVAPDHPEVKNVQNDFDALFEGSSSSSSPLPLSLSSQQGEQSTVRLFANVTVGGSDFDFDSDSNSNTNTNTNPHPDVTLDELRGLYDAVVLAYGCESDRELNLPVEGPGGEPLANGANPDQHTDKNKNKTNPLARGGTVLSARQFVNWYNGHPDFDWVTGVVRSALWKENKSNSNSKSEPKPHQSIVVVGHGNVALDCARILAKSREALDPTDLATRAIDVLRPKNDNSNSNDNNNDNDNDTGVHRSVTIVGRRGHVQAPFTIKEVRELTKLETASLHIRTDELERGFLEKGEASELPRPKARIHKLLTAHAHAHAEQGSKAHRASNATATATGKSKSTTTDVHLRFLCNPVAYRARKQSNSDNDTDSDTDSDTWVLDAVRCERTKLVGDDPGSRQAVGTGEFEDLEADLCLVSIGYKGLPIDDCTSDHYDARRGILFNDHGRVTSSAGDGNENENENDLAPLYVSGWLKRGPTGIIGTNIGDAKDTVASILRDVASGKLVPRGNPDGDDAAAAGLEDLLNSRGVRFVDWDSYRRIEARESGADRKRHPDQPREKLVDTEELLRAAAEPPR